MLADSFSEQSGVPVDYDVRGEPHELGPDARLAIYRTAQEALTNVRRHTAAERVEVRLDYLPAGPFSSSRITSRPTRPRPPRRRSTATAATASPGCASGPSCSAAGSSPRRPPRAFAWNCGCPPRCPPNSRSRQLVADERRAAPSYASCSPTTSASCARASARCSACSRCRVASRARPTATRRSRWPREHRPDVRADGPAHAAHGRHRGDAPPARARARASRSSR